MTDTLIFVDETETFLVIEVLLHQIFKKREYLIQFNAFKSKLSASIASKGNKNHLLRHFIIFKQFYIISTY